MDPVGIALVVYGVGVILFVAVSIIVDDAEEAIFFALVWPLIFAAASIYSIAYAVAYPVLWWRRRHDG